MATAIARTLAQHRKLFLTASGYRYVVQNFRQPSYHQDHGGHHVELSKREYWQTKYQESTDTFDWFLPEDVISGLACHCLLNIASKRNFSEVSDSMHKRVQHVNVLDLGCGNSVLPQCFYEWTPFPVAVHCLDYVKEAVDFQMRTLRKIRPGHRRSYASGVCASVCSLPYRSGLFHLITDKGTMDALLKDPINGTSHAEQMLTEVERILHKGGSFMQITDEDPDSRMYFLETNSPPSCQWKFSILVDCGQSDKECFVYSFSK